MNCRLTSVPQFSACTLSNVAQLTAGSHQCHSSVPAFEHCGTINRRLTSVPLFSACLTKIPHKSHYCHSHVCGAQIDALFVCFLCQLLPCWIFQALLCWFHALQKLFTAHHGSLDMTDIQTHYSGTDVESSRSKRIKQRKKCETVDCSNS